MQRLYPLCEKFSQSIAQLNQSFGKLDSELEWLKSTNDNETSQKEKETLFSELNGTMAQNNEAIEDLEHRLAVKMVEELNTTSVQCDEFVEDLGASISQVKDKYGRVCTKLAAYGELFEERKLKVYYYYYYYYDLLVGWAKLGSWVRTLLFTEIWMRWLILKYIYKI